jgi:molybdopterin synthase catalytic subunit
MDQKKKALDGHDHHDHHDHHEHHHAVHKSLQVTKQIIDRSTEHDYIQVTEERLCLSSIVQKVSSPEAGAISSFSGTTRNNFNGKKVLRLEYEAYVPMAEKEMRSIAHQVRLRWPEVLKVAIVHRIGLVPVEEASIIIAVSSPHRKDALEAVHFAIDEVKATVPIWKKEFYQDGQVWKENAECRFTRRTSCCSNDRPSAPSDAPPAGE